MDELIKQQLDNYREGFPYLDIIAAATPERGVFRLTEKEALNAIHRADQFSGTFEKFVPASGAASRMFKDLFEGFAEIEKNGKLKEASVAESFVKNIKNFPFYSAELFPNVSADNPLVQKEILEKVLFREPFIYGAKPKGQIVFHRYLSADAALDERRTAFEEHLLEGALYAKDSKGIVRLHFTVSPEHLKGFQNLEKELKPKYESMYGCKYQILFTMQNPNTNIVAVNMDNTPYFKEDGSLLMRPGGHGALLENLAQCDGDIIIIKNIDNIVNAKYIDETLKWKKVLIGKLIEVQRISFELIAEINKMLSCAGGCCSCSEKCTGERADRDAEIDKLQHRIIEFLDKTFCVSLPNLNELPKELQLEFLSAKLNRPIRICGMVKNTGEPGGGPYLIQDSDASTSLQILEASQLDFANEDVKQKVLQATHFNPVDIVCSIKNFRGAKFDLKRYVDSDTGFISEKSYEGHKIKAQELPGLWNGSMSNWNTMFVETPLITFNPVKTIMDLLRKEHKVD